MAAPVPVSIHVDGFEDGGPGVGVEEGGRRARGCRGDFEEVAAVAEGDEDAFGAAVHDDLEGFDQGTDG